MSADTGATSAYGANSKENELMMSRDGKSKPEVEDTGTTNNADSFEEFSGYTTLHGLRFIGDSTSNIPRRIFWMLLVLLCATLFGLQVYDRFVYYMTSPITVNLKVNYLQRAAFPAVTICNQNNFRISSAYESDWLETIRGIYGNNGDILFGDISDERLNSSITEMFVGLAQSKEDFIVRCQWENKACSAANFTTTLTSHGVCYTFNKVDSPGDSHMVRASGVEHGLSLTLNTEDYERMEGPHDTTGIKMLLTDQSEVPMVDEIGLAISPGSHAFVGASILTLNNLPPPHGVCGEAPLVTTDRYTQDSCMTECKTRYTYKMCGCRHFYMPDLTGEMPVCNVEQFAMCLNEALDMFSNVSRSICECPTPCFYHIYEPSVSYAASSDIKADLRNAVDENNVKKRLFKAKECASKTNAVQREELKRHSLGSTRMLQYTSGVIRDEAEFNIRSHFEFLDNLRQETEAAIHEMKAIYDMQLFVVQNNLMRARDEMEKTTFRHICEDYHGFVLDVQDKVTHIVANNQVDASVVNVMYLLLQGSLTHKEKSLKRALGDYKQLVNAYRQGELILNNTYLDYPLEDLVAVIPRKLLNESTETVLEKQDFLNMLESVRNFNAFVTNVFENKNVTATDDQVRQWIADFQQECETFMSKKTIFYSNFIDKPAKELKERIATFDSLEAEYSAVDNAISEKLLFLNVSVEQVRDELIPDVVNTLAYVMEYLNNSQLGITKYDVANTLGSQHTENEIYRVETFFEKLNARAYEIHDLWSTVESKVLDLWTFILNDQDSTEYYKYKGLTNFTKTFEERKSEVYDEYIRLAREIFDIRYVMEELDHSVLGGVQKFIGELNTYYDDHEMDEEFYRQNFLQVDVFFKELRSEQINQQRAYDAIALLCDIGGATGLFIGGSVMTVFEIVEFLCLCAVFKTCFKKAKPCTCNTKQA